MSRSMFRVSAHGILDFLLMATLIALLLSTMAGCMVQPVDSVTGAKIGPPISTLTPLPASPSGNPVSTRETTRVDVDRVVTEGNNAIQDIAPAFGPWGTAAAVVSAAAAATYFARRKKKPGE